MHAKGEGEGIQGNTGNTLILWAKQDAKARSVGHLFGQANLGFPFQITCLLLTILQGKESMCFVPLPIQLHVCYTSKYPLSPAWQARGADRTQLDLQY